MRGEPNLYVNSIDSKYAVPVPVSEPVAVNQFPTVPKDGLPEVATLYSTPATRSSAFTVTLFKNFEFYVIQNHR